MLLPDEEIRDSSPHPPPCRSGVSLPTIQRYVDKLLAGEVAPAIKVVPEVVEPHWSHSILDNTAALLKWLLKLPGGEGIAIISMPWYSDEQARLGQR